MGEWPIIALALHALPTEYKCLQSQGEHVEALLWTCILDTGVVVSSYGLAYWRLTSMQCCCPRGKSLSSRTNFQVLVLGHQVLVLVLVLESQVLDNNTASVPLISQCDKEIESVIRTVCMD